VASKSADTADVNRPRHVNLQSFVIAVLVARIYSAPVTDWTTAFLLIPERMSRLSRRATAS
jgi:hypothetical protein